jgi:hypothetical protein
MTALQQTQAEVYRVFEDWEALYAPSNLIKTTETASLILNWILNSGRVVSFTSLNAAVEVLGAQVLTPEPKQLTADELAAAENAKMHRDFMESIKPQESFDEKVARDKQARLTAQAAKAQSDAKGQIELAISGYQCYRTNGAGVDYTATEMMQRELRTVKVGNNFVRTLEVVKQIIQELPDHPKMGDVARVVERLNRETSSNSKPRKDSFGSGATFRG